jgi:kynurenine formamidase
MCHHCVTDAVKQKMLSRRDLLRATPTVAAAIAGTGLAAAPAFAQAPSAVEDMTHTLHTDFPTYFGESGFSMTSKFSFAEHGFNLFDLAINEHTGTHIDAPLHFSADGNSVDEIPVTSLVAPLAVIDIRARAAENPEAQVTPDDLRAWVQSHGAFPPGCCVALNSGWAAHVETPKFRNVDGEGKMRFPGFHVEAAQMLLEETTAVGIASDSLSLDIGSSANFATHYAWLPQGRWGIECLAGLDRVPASGATLIVGAPKHRGGSGGPSRIMALV